jgi:hypothetical protein
MEKKLVGFGIVQILRRGVDGIVRNSFLRF